MKWDFWILAPLDEGKVAWGGATRRSSGARVLDLLEAGRAAIELTRDLGTNTRTIYTWWRQNRIDPGWSRA
ncbi:hypothetical protein [Nonomuraea angiospora]|uniref:hypothetical protein n=1 Tax=Nonomuraea angiospora TaxID=46172 RepID=UPI0029ADDF4A|nr:hypothetical protein [Nonomuraea angiospora]MDX3100310.1 hypothetical protein [Nonomuraea angiospora]